MSKEAMKLALGKIKSARDCHFAAIDTLLFEAEEILEEALAEQPAQQALDKMAENARDLGLDYEPSSVSKLAREAGIRDCTCNGTKGCLDRFASLVRADERARMAEQPEQQEPVACVQDLDEVKRKHLVYEKGMDWKDPLYTSPPAQRTWQGLTDEEKRQIFEREDYQGWLDYINAIEAKLKEKNNG